MKKTYCFDIDNVICSTPKSKNYSQCKPKKKVINFINHLFNKGNTIKIFTARYMGRNKENISKAKKQGYKFTRNQLKMWGLKYHKLIMGKPSYDLFVDDKALGFKKNWISQAKKWK
ncbi:MAG: phosphoheptose isomerase [Candidatus Pelagibacter sp. TMED64]|nr:phosphoheptose isomerase [Candidatus Pelagibacter sp.]OUU66299.1 MAG: phosphoheptose isomerase [Candidatus Pelagibacter sp. TMED64]|tara:strand:+ start:4957 stop:5304 length:348 start_codon:yes stop_codon:yes gene_type:complete